MKNISESENYLDFTSILRKKSGQEIEPDFVLVEHAYALPWNLQSRSSTSRPRKTLFLSKIPYSKSSFGRDEIVDIESSQSEEALLPYDAKKGHHLMKECERHVVFAKIQRNISCTDDEDIDEEDWEERVNKNMWTESQHDLFSCIVKILDADQLAKLALQGDPNEPVKRRAVIDKTAGKFNQALSRIGWDMKLAQWLHNLLLQHMNTQYIAIYLDILQTLKSKIPTLIDKMISSSFSQNGSNEEALNLLLKRPWDPVSPSLNQFKPSKVENQPVVLQVPSGATQPDIPQNSRRLRFFNSQLQYMVKYISLSVAFDASNFELTMSEIKNKVAEYKAQYPGRPIVLLGWGIGAILACQVSLVEKVSAIICLGFPMMSFDCKRGEADDPLLQMTTPTLFVIGQKASDSNIDDIEDFRYRLRTQTDLVVISSANSLMKVSAEKCYWDGITQSMVDRCIVDEIGEFLTDLFTERKSNIETIAASSAYSSSSNMEGNDDFSLASAFTNPLPPRSSGRRDSNASRKRKLSPTSSIDIGNIQSSSKLLRTGDSRTAISQTLGLKIPLGVSSSKGEKSSTPPSTPSFFYGSSQTSEKNSPLVNENQMTDKSNKRQQVATKDIPANKLRISQGGTEPNLIDLQLPKASLPYENKPIRGFTSSFSSSTSTSSSAPVATIALGGLASVSRQKYQRMFQITESADSSDSILDWNSSNQATSLENKNVDIVGISSVVGATSSASIGGDFFFKKPYDVKIRSKKELLASAGGRVSIELESLGEKCLKIYSAENRYQSNFSSTCSREFQEKSNFACQTVSSVVTKVHSSVSYSKSNNELVTNSRDFNAVKDITFCDIDNCPLDSNANLCFSVFDSKSLKDIHHNSKGFRQEIYTDPYSGYNYQVLQRVNKKADADSASSCIQPISETLKNCQNNDIFNINDYNSHEGCINSSISPHFSLTASDSTSNVAQDVPSRDYQKHYVSEDVIKLDSVNRFNAARFWPNHFGDGNYLCSLQNVSETVRFNSQHLINSFPACHSVASSCLSILPNTDTNSACYKHNLNVTLSRSYDASQLQLCTNSDKRFICNTFLHPHLFTSLKSSAYSASSYPYVSLGNSDWNSYLGYPLVYNSPTLSFAQYPYLDNLASNAQNFMDISNNNLYSDYVNEGFLQQTGNNTWNKSQKGNNTWNNSQYVPLKEANNTYLSDDLVKSSVNNTYLSDDLDKSSVISYLKELCREISEDSLDNSMNWYDLLPDDPTLLDQFLYGITTNKSEIVNMKKEILKEKDKNKKIFHYTSQYALESVSKNQNDPCLGKEMDAKVGFGDNQTKFFCKELRNSTIEPDIIVNNLGNKMVDLNIADKSTEMEKSLDWKSKDLYNYENSSNILTGPYIETKTGNTNSNNDENVENKHSKELFLKSELLPVVFSSDIISEGSFPNLIPNKKNPFETLLSSLNQTDGRKIIRRIYNLPNEKSNLSATDINQVRKFSVKDFDKNSLDNKGRSKKSAFCTECQSGTEKLVKNRYVISTSSKDSLAQRYAIINLNTKTPQNTRKKLNLHCDSNDMNSSVSKKQIKLSTKNDVDPFVIQKDSFQSHSSLVNAEIKNTEDSASSCTSIRDILKTFPKSCHNMSTNFWGNNSSSVFDPPKGRKSTDNSLVCDTIPQIIKIPQKTVDSSIINVSYKKGAKNKPKEANYLKFVKPEADKILKNKKITLKQNKMNTCSKDQFYLNKPKKSCKKYICSKKFANPDCNKITVSISKRVNLNLMGLKDHLTNLQNEQEKKSSQNEHEKKSPQNEQKLKSPLNEQEIKSPQNDQEIKSPQNVQEIKIPQNVQKIKSPQNQQEIKSPQNDQEIKSPQNDQEIKSPQNDQEIKSPQNVQEIKSPQNVQEIKSPQNVQEIKSPQNVQKIKSPQNVQKIKSPQNVQKIKSPQNVQKIKSPQNVQKIKSPQNEQEIKSPQNQQDSKSPQNAPTLKITKNYIISKSPKNYQSLKSLKIQLHYKNVKDQFSSKTPEKLSKILKNQSNVKDQFSSKTPEKFSKNLKHQSSSRTPKNQSNSKNHMRSKTPKIKLTANVLKNELISKNSKHSLISKPSELLFSTNISGVKLNSKIPELHSNSINVLDIISKSPELHKFDSGSLKDNIYKNNPDLHFSSENQLNVISSKTSEIDLNLKNQLNDINSKTSEIDLNLKNQLNDINSKTSEIDLNLKNQLNDINSKTSEIDLNLKNHLNDINSKTSEIDLNLENNTNNISLKNPEMHLNTESYTNNINLIKHYERQLNLKSSEIPSSSKSLEIYVNSKTLQVRLDSLNSQINLKGSAMKEKRSVKRKSTQSGGHNYQLRKRHRTENNILTGNLKADSVVLDGNISDCIQPNLGKEIINAKIINNNLDETVSNNLKTKLKIYFERENQENTSDEKDFIEKKSAGKTCDKKVKESVERKDEVKSYSKSLVTAKEGQHENNDTKYIDEKLIMEDEVIGKTSSQKDRNSIDDLEEKKVLRSMIICTKKKKKRTLGATEPSKCLPIRSCTLKKYHRLITK